MPSAGAASACISSMEPDGVSYRAASGVCWRVCSTNRPHIACGRARALPSGRGCSPTVLPVHGRKVLPHVSFRNTSVRSPVPEAQTTVEVVSSPAEVLATSVVGSRGAGGILSGGRAFSPACSSAGGASGSSSGKAFGSLRWGGCRLTPPFCGRSSRVPQVTRRPRGTVEGWRRGAARVFPRGASRLFRTEHYLCAGFFFGSGHYLGAPRVGSTGRFSGPADHSQGRRVSGAAPGNFSGPAGAAITACGKGQQS